MKGFDRIARAGRRDWSTLARRRVRNYWRPLFNDIAAFSPAEVVSLESLGWDCISGFQSDPSINLGRIPLDDWMPVMPQESVDVRVFENEAAFDVEAFRTVNALARAHADHRVAIIRVEDLRRDRPRPQGAEIAVPQAWDSLRSVEGRLLTEEDFVWSNEDSYVTLGDSGCWALVNCPGYYLDATIVMSRHPDRHAESRDLE